jgi:hypothetical protein
MFMGINQIANQILNENPMNGYMNSIVFTRILGYDDIEQGAYWMDACTCWICSKWNYIQINYHPVNDKHEFNKKIEKMEQLQDHVNVEVNKAILEKGVLDNHVEVVEHLNEESELEELEI